jgi:hypothetical protein
VRRFEAEVFSGTVIESICIKFNVILRGQLEGHFLRKKLADVAVHILVGTAFPRGIGMGEKEVSAEELA